MNRIKWTALDDGGELFAEGDGWRAWLFRSKVSSWGWYGRVEFHSHVDLRIVDGPNTVRSLANCKRWVRKVANEYG